MKILRTPVDRNEIKELRASEQVTLSGEILVFRDQVHRIVCDMIDKGQPLPFNLKNAIVYYCGPTPARHGMPAGSAGPTTSGRMDKFTEPLLKQGLAMTIGKGGRSPEITRKFKEYNAVYMLATGGTGAYIAKHITAAEVIAFPELGTEAAHVFTVRNMPLLVGIDTCGESAFK